MSWKRTAFWCVVGAVAVTVPAVVALSSDVSSAKEPTAYTVRGSSLYDPCGQRVVVRGIEQYFANPEIFPDGHVITEAAKTGANAFRLVPYLGYSEEGGPADWGAMQPEQVEHLVRTALDDHMLADVALAGGKVDAAYLDPKYEAVLKKYQNRIVIHARGEGYEATGQEWESDGRGHDRQAARRRLHGAALHPRQQRRAQPEDDPRPRGGGPRQRSAAPGRVRMAGVLVGRPRQHDRLLPDSSPGCRCARRSRPCTTRRS